MLRALDLFCKAGGTSTGLSQAGYEVVGVDIEHQPHYPFEFHQSDWLGYLIAHCHEFDLIVAGPPCQEYGKTKPLNTKNYPDLIGPVRTELQATGKPYIIENVTGAPLINPLMLCGTMFGLKVQRHRIFECVPPLWWPPTQCQHIGRATACSSRKGKGTNSLKNGFSYVTVVGNDYLADEGRYAMGIDWMIKTELSQAIPPAYFKWLGEQMIKLLKISI